MEALSVLSAAVVPKGPSFVRRPEFSQELVREAKFNRSLFFVVVFFVTFLIVPTVCPSVEVPISQTQLQSKERQQLLPC